MNAVGLSVLLLIIGLYLSYWLIRLGVRHGIQDVLRRNFPHLEDRLSDNEDTHP